MEKDKSLISYLKRIKKPYDKFIWCINANSDIIQNIECNIPNKSIAKTFMFKSSLQDILSNDEATKILFDVEVVEEPKISDNDIFILVKCDNYNEKRKQLRLLGIK